MKKENIISKLPHLRKQAPHEAAPPSHVETIPGHGFSWIDIQNPTRDEINKLGEKYGFNELNLDDSISKIQLAKIDNYDDHSFIIYHFPPLVIKRGMPKFSQIAVFVGREFLITIHSGELKPLVDIVSQCKGSEQRRGELLKSPGFLLHKIMDALVDDLLHTLRRIVANLDEIEDDVFGEMASAPRKITLLRREITILRRIVNPLRKIVLETSKSIQRFSQPDDDLVLHFDDVIDHIDKVIETLEEAKETMEIYKDSDFVLSMEKTNKVLALMSILFTLAIPGTVIGTIYGMNVNLPGGVETGSWTFLGEFTSFILLMLIAVAASAVMFVWFYRRGWLAT